MHIILLMDLLLIDHPGSLIFRQGFQIEINNAGIKHYRENK